MGVAFSQLAVQRSASLLALGLIFCSGGVSAHASTKEIAAYVGYTLGANDDERMSAVSFTYHAPNLITWADGFVFTMGEFNGLDKQSSWNEFDDVPYYSAGVYWHIWQGDSAKIRFELAPTYVDGNYYYAHYVGSRWHFTSSLSYQYLLSGTGLFTALRFQHTSNGGLEAPNPGVDGLGIQFGYRW